MRRSTRFPTMSQPTPHPWLDRAWADLGVSAQPGPATDIHVHGYYADAGHPEVEGDDVAWCAAFVGACLARGGIAPSGSLLARSYLSYGAAIADARPGSIAVFSRDGDAALGHVAFVVGETAGALLILGGNQSHTVSVIAMPRDHLLGLRWPLTASPPLGPTPIAPQGDAAFSRALAHVLAMEGGYSDDPYDPGGPTNLGITLADLARFRDVAVTPELKPAVKALTAADVAPIYEALYWQPSFAAHLPPALALFHFDAAVNHGLGAAARMLQQALAVAIDGEIGPETLAAAAACDPAAVLAAYAVIRRARYRALPTFWRFGHGWLARVDQTLAAATPLLMQPVPSLPKPPLKEPSMSETATSMPNPATASEPKWWGQSLTIWGAIVTTLATVVPVAGPLVGLDISADTVHQIGDGVVRVAQALGGVIGIAMTIYGRARAVQPLIRRDFQLKL